MLQMELEFSLNYISWEPERKAHFSALDCKKLIHFIFCQPALVTPQSGVTSRESGVTSRGGFETRPYFNMMTPVEIILQYCENPLSP